MYDTQSHPLLEVRHLKKYFTPSRDFLSIFLGAKEPPVRAVDDVSLSVGQHHVLGVAGESGCGKTTLGRTTLKLAEPDAGQILYKGTDITWLKRRAMRPFRREMQIIFQDPYQSLNPRSTVFKSVAEPLEVNGLAKSRAQKQTVVKEVLNIAGLSPPEDFMHKFPYSLSGGERQRVAIATSLALNPRFIVADEPTSMLDVSVQTNLLALLGSVNEELGISFLFITHDLALAYAFVDELAIMYLGQIVEIGPVEEVIQNPRHPYTRALISVVPTTDLDVEKRPIILKGETPNPSKIPAGCRFHPRCPYKVEMCESVVPQLKDTGGGVRVACHAVSEQDKVG